MHISGTPEPNPAVQMNKVGTAPTVPSSVPSRPEVAQAGLAVPTSQPSVPAPEEKSGGQVRLQSADKVDVAYHVDPKASQVYIQFVDATTGEVINQLPPPQVLAFEEQVSKIVDSQGQMAPSPAVSRPNGPTKKVE